MAHPVRAPRARHVVRLALLRLAGRLLPRHQPAALPPTARLLLIRPDHLGDLLLSAPAVGLLRRALPTAHLAYLVGPWCAEAAQRGPAVDAVLTCPFPAFTRRPKPSALQPYTLLVKEAAHLRGRFDAALVLRPDHWWGALLAALAGIPLRLGFAVPECAPFLTHTVPIELDAERWQLENGSGVEAQGSINVGLSSGGLQPSTGNVQRSAIALARHLLDLAPQARREEQARSEPFRIEAAEQAWAVSWLAEHGLAHAYPLVVLHPGAGVPLKRWPAERWVAVGAWLAACHRARLLVTGGPDERDLAETVAAGIGRAAVCVAGQTSLGQLAALLARADLAIGPDSGPLHLAAAVGTPTVRLFGPTDPAIFMPPGQPHQRALVAALPCQPCHALEHPPCGARAAPACLLGLTVEAVEAAAARILEQASRPGRGG